ncbi:hypothetical protein DENSPDRAFT_841805 [Dentipellis sp. KUC8613]|nr:hypothetical protein DENSPDRAFT_841805 [Dentipellis sp. KUC8613]
MSLQSHEQVHHDRINLARLVRRLEKTVETAKWVHGQERDTFIKAQSMSEKLKFARKLLKNVEFYDEMEVSSDFRVRHAELRKTIDRLENVVENVKARIAPDDDDESRPEPILPTIPLPPLSARTLEQPASEPADTPVDTAAPEADLLLGPADEAPPPPTLPATKPASASPAFIQNSAALQDELAGQLAQMAGQLRRNAEHFSSSLARDSAVLQSTDARIGANLDVMQRERVRLRDHRAKSWGTTCLTFTSVSVVAVSFVVMFFIIRVT